MVEDVRRHWDAAFAQGDENRSWFQEQATTSVAMLEGAGVDPLDPVIDVGGGSARLVDDLLGRGFRDLTVLDVAPLALALAQRRLGGRAGEVVWIPQDLLSWSPIRRYAAWHDRAVFHFLVAESARAAYRRVLDVATEPGAVAVVGTFAPHGPTQCSGLPVARYDAAQLAAQFGPEWELTDSRAVDHRTPAGAVQPFTWVALRRRTSGVALD